MNCAACGAPNETGQVRCAYCGGALADVGSPDAITKLVEDKARQIVLEERQRELALAQNAAEQARADAARAELAQWRRSLDEMQAKLAAAQGEPPGFLSFSASTAILIALLFALVGVMPLSIMIEPLMGRSIGGATLFCPTVCDTCHGPGRIFNWQQTTNGTPESISLQLCDNAHVDIQALTTMDVVGRASSDLQPYRLTLWANALVDAFASGLAGLLATPFVVSWYRKKRTRRDRALYEAAVERLEAQMRAAERAAAR